MHSSLQVWKQEAASARPDTELPDSESPCRCADVFIRMLQVARIAMTDTHVRMNRESTVAVMSKIDQLTQCVLATKVHASR